MTLFILWNIKEHFEGNDFCQYNVNNVQNQMGLLFKNPKTKKKKPLLTSFFHKQVWNGSQVNYNLHFTVPDDKFLLNVPISFTT